MTAYVITIREPNGGTAEHQRGECAVTPRLHSMIETADGKSALQVIGERWSHDLSSVELRCVRHDCSEEPNG